MGGVSDEPPHRSGSLTEYLLPHESRGRRSSATSSSKIFERFLRLRQPYGSSRSGSFLGGESVRRSATTTGDDLGGLDGFLGLSRSGGGGGGLMNSPPIHDRKPSQDWAAFKKGRSSIFTAPATVYSAPVYIVSIPRWVLVDAEGNPVDVGSFVEEEKEEEKVVGGGHDVTIDAPPMLPEEEGEEEAIALEEPPAPSSPPPLLSQIADTRVAFEIDVKSEGVGESEWDHGGGTGGLPSKWKVTRTYAEFNQLYDTLVKTFGPEVTSSLKRPVVHDEEEGGDVERVLHVADVSSDMRALASFLRTAISLRLYCQELTDFLISPCEKGEGDGVGEMKVEVEEEEEGRHKSATSTTPFESKVREVDEVTYLKRLVRRMRRALPCGDQSIRLRTFKGVVSGSEICRWLLDSRECSARQEAVDLGVTLVTSGLLVPVVTGYNYDSAEEGNGGESSSSGRSNDILFSDCRLFLYRFGDKIGKQPFSQDDPEMVVVFGQPISVCVPKWRPAEGSEVTGTSKSGIPEPHIVYEIVISTPVEAWAVTRRYRDFSQLNKRLRWLGILTPEPLPPKRWARMTMTTTTTLDVNFLDERREGLESYLLAAVKAAQESPLVLGKPLMHFLDGDSHELRIGTADGVGPDILLEEEEGVDKEGESLDRLSKAVGGMLTE